MQQRLWHHREFNTPIYGVGCLHYEHSWWIQNHIGSSGFPENRYITPNFMQFRGAVVTEWKSLWTLGKEVPGSTLPVPAVGPMSNALYLHSLVPRRGLYRRVPSRTMWTHVHRFARNSSFCQVHAFEVLPPTSTYRQFIICMFNLLKFHAKQDFVLKYHILQFHLHDAMGFLWEGSNP